MKMCSLQRRVFALPIDDILDDGINHWRYAVINFSRLSLSVAAATVALGLLASGASAQTTPAAPAAPVAKAPPAPAAKAPPAAKAEAPVKAPAAKTEAPAKAAVAKKGASACKGLKEAECGGNADCQWIVPQKANAKTGKVAASYCKIKPKAKTAAPAAAAKAPAAKAAAPAAPAAPAKK